MGQWTYSVSERGAPFHIPVVPLGSSSHIGQSQSWSCSRSGCSHFCCFQSTKVPRNKLRCLSRPNSLLCHPSWWESWHCCRFLQRGVVGLLREPETKGQPQFQRPSSPGLVLKPSWYSVFLLPWWKLSSCTGRSQCRDKTSYAWAVDFFITELSKFRPS